MPEVVLLVDRLLDEEQVELVEAAEVVDAVAAVGLVGVDLQRHVGPASRGSTRVGSMSQPGWIFSFTRR